MVSSHGGKTSMGAWSSHLFGGEVKKMKREREGGFGFCLKLKRKGDIYSGKKGLGQNWGEKTKMPLSGWFLGGLAGDFPAARTVTETGITLSTNIGIKLLMNRWKEDFWSFPTICSSQPSSIGGERNGPRKLTVLQEASVRNYAPYFAARARIIAKMWVTGPFLHPILLPLNAELGSKNPTFKNYTFAPIFSYFCTFTPQLEKNLKHLFKPLNTRFYPENKHKRWK